MKTVLRRRFFITVSFFGVLALIGGLAYDQSVPGAQLVAPKEALASYQFQPTGGAIVLGTAPAILGATAASAEGVNMGDWRGVVADDNLHFAVQSTGSGYNAYLDIAGVALNNANKIFVQTEFDLDATVPNTLVQICDWVSSAQVDGVADPQCPGGGWRNLNLNDTAITGTTPVAYSWEIYNGYWDDGGAGSLDTPLSNFTGSSSTVRIRYVSGINTTSIVHIDFLRIAAVINPVYSPAGLVVTSGGVRSGAYREVVHGVGQSGSDDVRLSLPATATGTADFYFPIRNVRTYSGANTILVRAEYSCSATGNSHRPKVYNFTTGAWEFLTLSAIACATGDVANAWARNNVNLSDYLLGGELRIGWETTSTGTQAVRLDQLYVMIGTTNSNNVGEISFGTLSAGSATSTQNLDMTGTADTWRIAAADESNTQAFATYGYDSDQDGTVEEASAANLDFSVVPPDDAFVTGIFFASRHMSGTGGTVQVGIKDYSGFTNTLGGWSPLGATGGTALVYTDNITVGTVTSGGVIGFMTNPGHHVSYTNNLMNLRLRTTAAGTAVTNSIAQWDFAMVSIQWVESADYPGTDASFGVTGGAIVTGSNPAILGATANGTEGVNTGDWRGALADDNVHFAVQSTSGGYDAYLDTAGVALNAANTIHIQTEFDLDATAPNTVVQICDWVSSVGVHGAADARCPGGGWRNINLNDAVINTVTPTAYHWQIYDGYWDTSATSSIATPLSNFVGSSSTVRIRFFSNINTTSIVNIDYLRLAAVINPVYSPGGATQLSGGTILGNYSQAVIGGAGQTGLDNAYLIVPATASAVADFYFSFFDVRTYTGMNSIVVRSEYSCNATGNTHRPKIYNFTTASWEDLTTASIACSTSDALNAWAVSNVTMSDYVNNGELRVGWRTLATGTQQIRIDSIYVVLGTTETTGSGEVTYGTTLSGSATSTRNLDMTGTSQVWSITSANETNTQSFASYANDSDNDAVLEEASAANLNFSTTVPVRGMVTGIFFASRYMSGVGGTVQPGIRDYSGFTNVTGGWSPVGAGGTTVLQYSDNIAAASVASGGAIGWITNPEDHVDMEAGLMNMRLRTSSAGASTSNSVAQWDFAQQSLQWVEVPIRSYITFSLSDTAVGFGALTPGASRYASGDRQGSVSSTSPAHAFAVRTNASGGYVVFISGTGPRCSGCGDTVIDPVGLAATTEVPGTEQFGARLQRLTGTASPSATFGLTTTWAFPTTTEPIEAVTGAGDGVESTMGVWYMANVSAATVGGLYSAPITFTVTGTF